MRTATFITLTLILLAKPTAVQAEDPARPLGLLEESVIKMFDWFGVLLDSAGSLAKTEDRRRLVDDLSRLSKGVYDLEGDKRFLLEELQRTPISLAAVEQGIDDSERSLRLVRDRLRASGLSLRQQFQLGGQEVERSLGAVIGSRKRWLEDLRKSLRQNPRPSLEPAIKQGGEVVEALSKAHERLVQLIAKLQAEEAN